MWNAIKSDLFDFVNTIQNDATNTITKVLGEDEVEENTEENLLAKWIADAKRSYETYALQLRENRAKEFERFKKKFTLAKYANEIASVLDEEPEVSRFYAELVPIEISPEEFWARLFFRLHLLTRTKNVNFEEDDEEEELVWEEEEVVFTAPPSTADSDAAIAMQKLLDENKQLKSQVEVMAKRIAELESTVEQKNKELQELMHESKMSLPSPESSESSPRTADDVLGVAMPSANVTQHRVETASMTSSHSESSGLVINHSDVNSFVTDDENSNHGNSNNVKATPATHLYDTPQHKESNSGSNSASKTSYLAALDDDEEETWG